MERIISCIIQEERREIMSNFTCKNCTHFHQHYILSDQHANPIGCGHCSYPRQKKRKPDTPACKHFQAKTGPDPLPNRAEVLHFLTVDAIQRIFQLTLPPEIVAAKDEEGE